MASIADGLMRRVQHLFTGGSSTTAGDDSGNVQTVQVRKNDIQVQDAVPVAFPYGFSSNAPIGSNVLHMGISGDLSNGVIVGKNHPQSRPRNLGTGCTVVYDQIGSRMDLTNDGNLSLAGKGTLFLHFDNVVINGKLIANGDIIADGANGVSLINHVQSNGGGSGNSGPPVMGT